MNGSPAQPQRMTDFYQAAATVYGMYNHAVNYMGVQERRFQWR